MNLNQIREYFTLQKKFTTKLVDNFLIDYVAAKFMVEKKMEREFSRFDHIAHRLGAHINDRQRLFSYGAEIRSEWN